MLSRDPQILAGVFRRVLEPDHKLMLDAIVENLILADAEKNMRVLMYAYKRMKPTVLTFADEELDEHGNLRLKIKKQPSVPGPEILAPGFAAANA